MTPLYPSTTLVVVDSTVKDYQDLIRSAGFNTEIIVLDAAHDGIEQITDKLRNYHGLSSLHILSHGEPGAVRLGNVWLSLATIERYADQIQSWAKSIAQDASVFLYGCRVAAGTLGQSFVQQLSQLLCAPIAASATPTGNAALGGDWVLEFTTGTINAASPFASDAVAAYPHVLAVPVNLLTETFTGNDVVDKRWLFGVENAAQGQLNPFLTARGTADAPTGGLPGNPSPGSAPYPTLDQPGNGVLRLTNATNNQASYVLYNNPLPASAGLIIEFDFFSYGGTGADGINFFLADGANPPTEAGGFGGSLGYAQIDAAFQGEGVQSGYLGIGFDEYGNYSNPSEGRVGGIGRTLDAIAVRGSQAVNYAYLTGTGTLPYGIDAPNATTREEAARRVRIQLSPTGILSVQIDVNRDSVFDPNDPNESPASLQNFNVVAVNGALPDTFTFGFTSGTGASTNNHEIRNLQVSQPTSPPEVADATLNLPAGTVAGVPGLSATDSDGTIASYTITTLPPAEQGTLYLGNPAAGGTPIAAGQVLTPAQIGQVFFQSTPGFTGATFTYNATDDIGAVDQTPGTVTLALQNPNNDLPVANNGTAELTPSSVTRLPELTARDPDGTIASYTIVSLPPTTQGILYLGNPSNGGTPIAAGQVLTPAQVGQLFFQAEPDFTGGRFTFYATDNEGGLSNVATVSLDDPTNNALPVASNNTVELNPDSTRRLPALVATDTDGTIASYTIDSFPPRGQGRLYLGNPENGGRLVERGETLTPAQVRRLFFQAEPDFTGGRLTFFATDNEGGVSNTATVTLSAGIDIDPGIDPGDENCEPGIRRRGGSGSNRIRGTGDIDTLLGGGGSDILRGLDCPDLLQGNQGNDQIFGGNAGDTVNGGLGRDRLNGENGNDQILGRRGNDTLDGGKGNDQLFGLLNNDRLNGRTGNDSLVGGAGSDTVSGGANTDTIEGRQSRDRITGNNGNDTTYGNLGFDTIGGGNGDDAIYGGKGNDRIRGNSGADFLTGQRSNDQIHGGSQSDYAFGDVGDDTLTGGGGADTLNGSLGVDRFLFKNINHGGDLIEGFQLSDVFDFSRILARDGYTRTGTFAYIRQVQSGEDVVIRVDSNGDRAGGFINYLTIQGSTSTDLANGGQVTANNFVV